MGWPVAASRPAASGSGRREAETGGTAPARGSRPGHRSRSPAAPRTPRASPHPPRDNRRSPAPARTPRATSPGGRFRRGSGRERPGRACPRRLTSGFGRKWGRFEELDGPRAGIPGFTLTPAPLPQAGEGTRTRNDRSPIPASISPEIASPRVPSPSSPLPPAGEGPGVRASGQFRADPTEESGERRDEGRNPTYSVLAIPRQERVDHALDHHGVAIPPTASGQFRGALMAQALAAQSIPSQSHLQRLGNSEDYENYRIFLTRQSQSHLQRLGNSETSWPRSSRG